ncbi:transposase [Alkalimonas sp. MEB108]|uniref:Transposase n=1 Tax=Alkalimonas cellulosilytica TaxID=3058395 RepID=A0ABU7JA27_9GAMM|nr:transposase [Alkalimonas sp. MEB108]
MLSNNKLLAEMPCIYALMTRAILANSKHPIILVDWSNADTRKQNHILRASLALEGRSLTLLLIVAPTDDYNSPRVHSQFLKRLKLMLPSDCKPVIVTDAGFKVPWFKAVRKSGWHFIGRVRGNQHVKLPEHDEFISVQELYKKARCNPNHLGCIELAFYQFWATSLSFSCHFFSPEKILSASLHGLESIPSLFWAP